MNNSPVPRALVSLLAERLETFPVVVLTGARQVGKSTLVRELLPGRERVYLTLDDLDVRARLRRTPDDLLEGSQELVLDEVQREPDLLLAVKRAVDRDRRPGRFLLTGSANLLLLRRTGETLAGRAVHLVLRPLTRRELRGEGTCGRWEELLASPDREWRSLLGETPSPRADWRALAARGGFPVPALHLRRARDRAAWFDGFVRTYLERDLLDLSAVQDLPDFRRLMRAAALRLGQLQNQSSLARDLGIPQPTVHRWLNLLEASWLLVRLPAWTANRGKRLVRSPRLYWGDTGLALRLAGDPEPGGPHLENLVLLDLLAWRDSRGEAAEIYHWRTVNGEEVDLVVEAGDRLLPIEVKSTRRPRIDDARHLLRFRRLHGDACRPGLLLHCGPSVDWIAPGVLAVPWWRLL